MAINTIQVWGERNSGTNYLHHLLLHNLRDVHFTNDQVNFGWRHGDIGQVVTPLNAPEASHLLTPNENSLHIVVYRNPFDWLNHMHRRPRQNPLAYRIGMHQFLRQPWESYVTNQNQDISPYHLERKAAVKPENLFERHMSILQLRQKKIDLFEGFSKRVDNVVYINVEVLQSSPELIVNQIAKAFQIEIKEEFEDPVTQARHIRHQQYEDMAPMTTEDVRLIVAQSDWRRELKIGYVLDPLKAFIDLSMRPALHPLARDHAFVKNAAKLTVVRHRIRISRSGKIELLEL